MKREALEMAFRSAGADNDKRRFLRLYAENRISFDRAKELFSNGKQFARFIKERDNDEN